MFRMILHVPSTPLGYWRPRSTLHNRETPISTFQLTDCCRLIGSDRSGTQGKENTVPRQVCQRDKITVELLISLVPSVVMPLRERRFQRRW